MAVLILATFSFSEGGGDLLSSLEEGDEVRDGVERRGCCTMDCKVRIYSFTK